MRLGLVGRCLHEFGWRVGVIRRGGWLLRKREEREKKVLGFFGWQNTMVGGFGHSEFGSFGIKMPSAFTSKFGSETKMELVRHANSQNPLTMNNPFVKTQTS